ncbi:hypothetical protein [Helcobacillus massiliensis]|uniref:Uncharacterized protein n=1 Tax=Helcobacillus massiliensis TaxID=521392 RepID=A0A839QQV3_9MICO|nr:hypothetical protein [Helcobacillus massiliensis]MBB3022853.1 hypothetical protein [Helcobacillus massiliensis]
MIQDEDDDHGVDPDDEYTPQAEEPEPDESSEEEVVDRNGGFRMPSGFASSLLPNMDNFLASIVAPFQERMSSVMPDYSALAREAVAPINERLQEQMASIVASVPTFSVPALDLPALQAPVLGPATLEMLKGISEQHARTMEGLWGSLEPLFDPAAFRGLNRALLPSNLKEYAGEIRASDVHEFVEQEGIPLYLVPRGRTALRLLRAKDRAGRRRVLSDCYESLMEDCADVLERADHEAVSNELGFALDGLGAMRAGHARSAQAMFTVTLDTLIYRFYPDRKAREVITNRKRDAGVPEAIDEMGVREALVWLPIWNAHEQFWKDKGDKVPHYYSRHASVHGVSSRQFNKRNCIQVLMLVTSLIGYADRVARESG